MRTDKLIGSKALLWNKTKFSCLITVRVTRKCTAISEENYQSDLGSGTVKRNVIDFLVSSDDVTNMFADVFPTTPTCGWLTSDHYMCIGHSCPTRIDLSLWRNSFQSLKAFISESICLISQKIKLACYLWFLDFHDSIVENHRYTIPSWVNTCELVRQVFMHINYHTSSQFSSVKVMTRFLPLDLSFMNSSISSSSSAAVFFVAVTVLSAILGTRGRNLTGVYLTKEQPRSTGKGDSFLVLLLPLQQLRLIGIGNDSSSMSCAMVLRGKTKMAHT